MVASIKQGKAQMTNTENKFEYNGLIYIAVESEGCRGCDFDDRDNIESVGCKLDDASYRDWETDRKSTRLNSSHRSLSRMPSSA